MPHTPAHTRTPADDLRVVLDHWQHMRDLIDTATPAPWPPAPDRAHYLRALDEHDAAEVARGRLELPEQSAPLRLHVVDACRAVEVALAAVADEIAAEVQRSVIAGPDPAWPSQDREKRRALVAADAADPRRWHYTLGDRTAPAAARWLLDRLTGPAGPCSRITLEQRARITRVAREAARRVERTIGAEQRAVPMDEERPCPWCGGRLVMHRDTARNDAAVTCAGGYDCGAPVPVDERGRRSWATPHALLELRKALDIAERRRKRRDQKRAERARRRVA